MVFACLKCAARFRVADDRLAGKVLRFVCPKCGQVHLLRDPAIHPVAIEAAPSASETSSSSATAAAPTRHPTISEVRLTQSAPTFVPRTAPAPGGPPTTQTSALPAVPTPPPATLETWYAIRHGQRIGPFSREELLGRLSAGELHERSFLWRPTMAAWTRLNQIPELADLLAAYLQSKASAEVQSGTSPPPQPTSAPTAPTTRPTPAAPAPEDSDLPPPLPRRASEQTVQPPTSVQGTRRDRAGEHVDALFSHISRPAIDLRKAQEVQPEEPDIPDSVPRAARSRGTRTAVSKVVRREEVVSRPSSVEPPSEPFAETPSDIAVTPEEKRFFSRAFVLPSEAWPTVPSAEPAPSRVPERTRPAVAEDPRLSRERESVPRLKDFSVMFRLTRKSKRRSLAIYGSLGALVLIVIGLVLYWSFSAGPADLAIATRESGEVPTFRQTLYTVPKPQIPPEETSNATAPDERRRPAPRTSTGASGSVSSRVEVPKPELAKAPEVDPSLSEEFQKYAGILGNRDSGRSETVVDVKPRTLTEMPQHRFDRDGMDAFLASKMRKFSDCKARMKRKTDLPVKVVLGFSIGLDGKVRDILVEQAAGPRDEGLDECIRRIVSGWAFPPPEEEANIRTTLLL